VIVRPDMLLGDCKGGECMIHGIPGWGLSGCILNRRQLDKMRRIEGQ
jgi:hypothetical protein